MAIKIRKKKNDTDTGSDEEQEGTGVEGIAEPDAFVETSLGVSKWLQLHWKKLAIGVGIVAVGAIGLMLYSNQKEAAKVEASAALNQATLAAATPTRPEIQAQLQQMAMLGQQVADIEDINFRRMFDDDTQRVEAVFDAATATIANHGDSEVVGEAHLIASAAATRLGKKEEAASHAEQAMSQLDEGASAFALQAKAVALVDANDLEGALSSYEQLKSIAPKHYGALALMQIGQISEWNGDTEAAASAYAELAAMYPDDVQSMDARRRLGMLVSDAETRINALAPATDASDDGE